MAGKQTRAVVVGASTIRGKELTEELNSSPAAIAWNTHLFDDGEETETQLTAAGDEPVVIQPFSAAALEDADLVFFAGDAATTREFWKRVVASGAAVVDLTGSLEAEAGFSVRCPWLPGGKKPDLTTLGIVAAHPAALMLALAYDRLGKLGVTSLSATVLEPASQMGTAGLDELHQQTVGLLSFQNVPKEIFDVQVAFNLQESLGEAARVQPRAVGEIIRRHLHLLLPESDAGRIRFNVVQAPVFHGYTISALAEFGRAVREDEVRAVLNGGVIAAEDDTIPSNLAAAESGDLLVQVHIDEGTPAHTAHWLWMAADNLRLAARGAIAGAVELAALHPTTHVQ